RALVDQRPHARAHLVLVVGHDLAPRDLEARPADQRAREIAAAVGGGRARVGDRDHRDPHGGRLTRGPGLVLDDRHTPILARIPAFPPCVAPSGGARILPGPEPSLASPRRPTPYVPNSRPPTAAASPSSASQTPLGPQPRTASPAASRTTKMPQPMGTS